MYNYFIKLFFLLFFCHISFSSLFFFPALLLLLFDNSFSQLTWKMDVYYCTMTQNRSMPIRRSLTYQNECGVSDDDRVDVQENPTGIDRADRSALLEPVQQERRRVQSRKEAAPLVARERRIFGSVPLRTATGPRAGHLVDQLAEVGRVSGDVGGRRALGRPGLALLPDPRQGTVQEAGRRGAIDGEREEGGGGGGGVEEIGRWDGDGRGGARE